MRKTIGSIGTTFGGEAVTGHVDVDRGMVEFRLARLGPPLRLTSELARTLGRMFERAANVAEGRGVQAILDLEGGK